MQTATGQWFLGHAPDGSYRYEWRPEPQPPSPDSRPGVWHWLPGAGEGTGDWIWYPAAPPVDNPDESVTRLQKVSRPRKPVLIGAGAAAMVVLLLLLLTTRGGGSSERPGTSTLSDGDKKSTLVTTANSYMAALVSGKGAEAVTFLDRTRCTDIDRNNVKKLAQFLAQDAKGATVTVSSVEVDGDDGNVKDYTVSAGAPEAFRAAIEQGYTTGGEFSWHLQNNRWVFDSEC